MYSTNGQSLCLKLNKVKRECARALCIHINISRTIRDLVICNLLLLLRIISHFPVYKNATNDGMGILMNKFIYMYIDKGLCSENHNSTCENINLFTDCLGHVRFFAFERIDRLSIIDTKTQHTRTYLLLQCKNIDESCEWSGGASE